MLTSSPSTRKLLAMLVALAMCLGVVLGEGATRQAHAQEQVRESGDLSELRLSWRRLDERHKQLAGAMRKLEGEHVQLTRSIEQIKRKGVTSFNRAQLRDLLRQGRKGAERLGALQDQLREVEAQQARVGARLVQGLDRHNALLALCRFQIHTILLYSIQWPTF